MEEDLRSRSAGTRTSRGLSHLTNTLATHGLTFTPLSGLGSERVQVGPVRYGRLFLGFWCPHITFFDGQNDLYGQGYSRPMKRKLLDILACPIDKHYPLQMVELRTNGEIVVDGVLVCSECRRYFPIIDEIPVMLPDDL